VLSHLGGTDCEVEEIQSGQKHLEEALEVAEEAGGTTNFSVIIPVLACLNQLGILWCKRAEFDRSKEFLTRALDTYKSFKAKEGESSLNIEDILDFPQEKRSSSSKKERDLDLLNVHTFFFLAQLHEKLGETERATHFCHLTLAKQLRLKNYDLFEWVTNAATLSSHYLATGQYKMARHMITAARTLLKENR